MLPSSDMDAVARYCDALWQTRSGFNATLDDIASYAAPERGGFTAATDLPREGREKIWDSAPEDAALTLASALHGMLTNPATDWLRLTLAPEARPAPSVAMLSPSVSDDAAEFLQTVTDAMLQVYTAPASCFANEVSAFYLDLACFGWAVLYTEWRDGCGVRFRAVPPSQCAIAEDAAGMVDTVLRRWTMTPAQLAEEFGPQNVSDGTRTALGMHGAYGMYGGQKAVNVSHLVAPRDRLPEEMTEGFQAQADAWLSIHYETETKHVLRRGFFAELPYAVPRWHKRSGEVYGRGPGHACLPDMRVLNRVALSQLIGAEKLADPPLLAAGDSVIGKIKTHSGGITYVDATQCPGGDTEKAVRQMPVAYSLDAAELILEKRRAAIRSAFLNDRIQLVGGPQMTATEVIARERKQNLVLGPVLGRLESEFLGPNVSRVFLLLCRNGIITPPPELAGAELRARYVSPISRAQRQGEAEAFGLAMQHLAPALQLNPGIVENFDFDRIARDSQELFGFPEVWLVPEEEVARRRKERARQAEQAQMMETLQGGAV